MSELFLWRPGLSQAARRRLGLGAALGLLAFVLLLYFPLLFTNRVLASGDILLYVYPYRAYAASMLRLGQIPLWNPYIFLGAPFLANPQAAVLYPLHWPLIWLPVTKQVYWSAALHTWLLGFGGYLLLRRWHVTWAPALVGGLVLAGSGFYSGLIGHLNQMNAAAWLPWGIWILERSWPLANNTPQKSRWGQFRQRSGDLVAFAVIVALMVLAGHTQTAYINLFGLGAWTVWPGLAEGQRVKWRLDFARLSLISRVVGPRLFVYGGGVLVGVLISAAQLAPTLELSGLGLRSGGLSYGEATSFSLKPLHLPWTLLPSYGLADLGAVFATPGYSEYMAYVGLAGLLLAAIGAWRGTGQTRTLGLLFVILGLLLALGRWNPLYYGLYLLVPGFDLFRNPARWMMLYTLGMAVLAGAGLNWLLTRRQSPISNLQPRVSSRILPTLLVILVAGELLLAARATPHSQTTAPQAVVDVRTAPAHLLTDPVRTELGPAAMGRFLGMSTITYDPGDLADWQRILRTEPHPQLDQRAFEQLIIALKVQELIAPNLSLLWQLPAVDGFDGGVLPLQRYNEFLTLFVPATELVPDGRLREQIRTVPNAMLLNLLNVQYLITDKVRDLWFDNVFYDRQIGATLRAAGPTKVQMTALLPFAATQLGVIGYVTGDEAALQALAPQTIDLARVHVQGLEATVTLTITAGGGLDAHWADGALDSPLATNSRATVAYRDVEGKRQEYLARLSLPQPMTPLTVTIERLASPMETVIQALTLIDARTGMFMPWLPSDRGRFQLVHSGDVKIYENLDVTPRAYLAHQVIGAATAVEALARLRRTDLPGGAAVAEGLASFTTPAAAGDYATITKYAAEEVVIQMHSQTAALLVLSDTAYPGWVATVDGVEAPIYSTNYLLRGVPVPAGDHTIVFAFRPQSWRLGLWISGIGLALWAGLLGWGRGMRNT